MFLQNQFNFEPKKIKAQKSITTNELFNLTAASNAVLREPDFAEICGFLQKFSFQLNLNVPSFQNLIEWISDNEKLPLEFQRFIMQLFIKAGRPIMKRKFQEDLSAYCATYSMEDAEIVKNKGLHALSVPQKLRLLKELLESLLVTNTDLMNFIERQTPSELRAQQLGRDRNFQHYWLRQTAVGSWSIYMGKGVMLYAKPVAYRRKQVLELIAALNSGAMSDSGIGNEENNNNNNNNNINNNNNNNNNNVELTSSLLTPDEQQLVIFLRALAETVFTA